MNQNQIDEKRKELDAFDIKYKRVTNEWDEQLLSGKISWSQYNRKLNKLNHEYMLLLEVKS